MPKEVIHKIESIMASFLWSINNQMGKIHLVRWSLLTRMIYEGEWGIMEPSNFNKYLVIKNMWREMIGSNLWSDIIREKYMHGQPFTTWIHNGVRKKTSMSAIWRSMMKNLH